MSGLVIGMVIGIPWMRASIVESMTKYCAPSNFSIAMLACMCLEHTLLLPVPVGPMFSTCAMLCKYKLSTLKYKLAYRVGPVVRNPDWKGRLGACFTDE